MHNTESYARKLLEYFGLSRDLLKVERMTEKACGGTTAPLT
jgi:hypothetical protein